MAEFWGLTGRRRSVGYVACAPQRVDPATGHDSASVEWMDNAVKVAVC